MARVVYLAEAGLGLEERVRRSKNELLWSLHEQREIGWNGADATDQIDRILRTADATGIGTLRPTRRAPRRLADRPSATSLVGQLFLDAEHLDLGSFMYKLLSATAHGTLCGLTRFVRE